jgi:hypothetical protein
MGSALGLNTTPSFHFRFSRYEVDDDTVLTDIHDWDTYNTTEQLTIMARLAFIYQHRQTEPSFTIMLRENHLLSINCLRHGSVYNLNMSLNKVDAHLRVYSHTPHAVEFVLTSWAQTPFPEFEFAWKPTFEDE